MNGYNVVVQMARQREIRLSKHDSQKSGTVLYRSTNKSELEDKLLAEGKSRRRLEVGVKVV